MDYTLAQLAKKVEGRVKGDPDLRVEGLGTLESGTPNQIGFLANPKYQSQLASTTLGAVLVKDDELSLAVENAIIVKNPYLAFAALSHLFVPTFQQWEGVNVSCVISKDATIAENVIIAPNVVIDADAVIEDGCVIGAGCVIGRGVRIGRKCHIYPNVTLYHDVSIGTDCIIHSGVVIGADGFGFAPTKKGWEKINQLGSVEIGNRVEIGANTTIDRGAIENTKIGDGVKIDNQVQIAHNVVIGDNTAIAGCAAIAGSTKIGSFCTIAGGVGIVGHLKIADCVHITAMSLVSKSILKEGSYSSGTGLEPTDKWRRSAARLRRIDDMAKQISKLEQQVNKLLTEG